MQATARRLSVVSATSCARRRLIRNVRPRNRFPMIGKVQNQKARGCSRGPFIWGTGIVALVALGVFYFSRHTISHDQLSGLKTGMTKAEVIRLVGTPSSTLLQTDGSTMLAYRKQDRWCMVDVFLDAGGHVQSVFHDH